MIATDPNLDISNVGSNASTSHADPHALGQTFVISRLVQSTSTGQSDFAIFCSTASRGVDAQSLTTSLALADSPNADRSVRALLDPARCPHYGKASIVGIVWHGAARPTLTYQVCVGRSSHETLTAPCSTSCAGLRINTTRRSPAAHKAETLCTQQCQRLLDGGPSLAADRQRL